MRKYFRTPTLDECIQISYCHRDKEENLRYWKYRLEHEPGSVVFHDHFKLVSGGVITDQEPDDCSWDMYEGLEENE
jgi:hypothetical protein